MLLLVKSKLVLLSILESGRITDAAYLLLQTEYRGLSVGLSVMLVSPALFFTLLVG